MKLTPIFPANILPVRSGVYKTISVDAETQSETESIWQYSFYDSDDRIWGCSANSVDAAIASPDFEFAHQSKKWRGLEA